MERSAADGAKLQKHLDAEKSKSEKLKVLTLALTPALAS